MATRMIRAEGNATRERRKPQEKDGHDAEMPSTCLGCVIMRLPPSRSKMPYRATYHVVCPKAFLHRTKCLARLSFRSHTLLAVLQP
jgi:hypothetical protein